MIARLVSGGQTGVDRAALDVALALGVRCGGWCPRGRRAEDGVIAARYPLRETSAAAYAQRTARNVRDSDATLVLLRGRAAGGTRATLRFAAWRRRPVLVVRLDRAGGRRVDARSGDVAGWLRSHRVRILNVAGPRESESPGVHADAVRFLRDLLAGAGRLTSRTER
ncbi:MAG: putative molybdenum carrier protein [Alphaproteobacteria bacterium]